MKLLTKIGVRLWRYNEQKHSIWRKNRIREDITNASVHTSMDYMNQ